MSQEVEVSQDEARSRLVQQIEAVVRTFDFSPLGPSQTHEFTPGGALRLKPQDGTPQRPANISALQFVDNPNGHPAVAIAVPLSWDFAPKQFTQSLYGLKRWEGCRLIQVDGGTIYQMRNVAVETARKYQSAGILFVDADMSFPADALERIVAHNRPIVGGFCRKRRKPFEPTIWTMRDGQLFTVHPKGTGLLPCDATGAAFLYVHMSVFDKIEKPYFINRECAATEVIDEKDFLSEDLYFCLKAREAGIPIYVDLDLKIGHMTWGIITSDDHNEPQILLQ